VAETSHTRARRSSVSSKAVSSTPNAKATTPAARSAPLKLSKKQLAKQAKMDKAKLLKKASRATQSVASSTLTPSGTYRPSKLCDFCVPLVLLHFTLIVISLVPTFSLSLFGLVLGGFFFYRKRDSLDSIRLDASHLIPDSWIFVPLSFGCLYPDATLFVQGEWSNAVELTMKRLPRRKKRVQRGSRTLLRTRLQQAPDAPHPDVHRPQSA
jgi:hypothetical protein